MQMLNLSWHDYLVLISFAACVTGLFLLSDGKQTQADDLEETEETLFKMSFAGWCTASLSAFRKSLYRLGNPAAEFEDNCCSVLLLTFAAYFVCHCTDLQCGK